jgi:hypothetical protein
MDRRLSLRERAFFRGAKDDKFQAQMRARDVQGVGAASENAVRRTGPLAYGATGAQVPFGGRKEIILHS